MVAVPSGFWCSSALQYVFLIIDRLKTLILSH
uniref:Uncharacterized protein n=1 Tax=Anguilla anguilla TaxID=7936 RepID=A0A0E9XKP2_ANGAN